METDELNESDIEQRHSALVKESTAWCRDWVRCATVYICSYSALMPVYIVYSDQVGQKSSAVVSATIAGYFSLQALSDFILLWLTNDSIAEQQNFEQQMHLIPQSSSTVDQSSRTRTDSSSSSSSSYGLSEQVFLFQFWIMTLGLTIQALAIDFASLTVGLMFTAVGLCTPLMLKALIIRLLPQSQAMRLTNVHSALSIFGMMFGRVIGAFIAWVASIRAVFIFFAAVGLLTAIYATVRLFGREKSLCFRMREFAEYYRTLRIHQYRMNNNNNTDDNDKDGAGKVVSSYTDVDDKGESTEMVHTTTTIKSDNNASNNNDSDSKVDLNDESNQFPIARNIAGLRTAEENSLIRRFSGENSAVDLLDNVDDDIEERENIGQVDWGNRSVGSEASVYGISVCTVVLSWEYLPTLLSMIYIGLLFSTEAISAVWFNPYLKHRYSASVSIGNLILASMSLSTVIMVVIITKRVIPKLIHHDNATPESREYSLSKSIAVSLGIFGLLYGIFVISVAPEFDSEYWYLPMFVLAGLPNAICMTLSEAENVRGNVQGMTGKLSAVRLLIVGAMRALFSVMAGIAWKWRTPSLITQRHRNSHLWTLFLFGMDYLLMAILPVLYFVVLRPIRISMMNEQGRYEKIIEYEKV